MQDHREVQKNFRKAERMESGDRELQQIVEQTCAALTLHAEIEEQVFYPAVRQATDDQDMMEEAQVEHDSAKQLIAQLQGMGPRDDRYKATFKVLGEYVNHHIEEEEGQIFRAARRAKLDLDAIGEQIMMLKQGGEAGEAMGQSAAGESSGKRRGNRSDSSSAARGRSRGGRSAGAQDDARESSQGDDDEAESTMTAGRTGGDSSEDTERPGRGGRSARGSSDGDDEEIDVETPGGSSRYGSH